MAKDPKTKQVETEETSTHEPVTPETEDQLVVNEASLNHFVTILKSTNQISADFELQGAGQAARADVIGKYAAWLEAGKPMPEMPEVKPKEKQCLRCYRIKSHGTEYLYHRAAGEVVPVGVKEIPVYRQVEENGRLVNDVNHVLKWNREYLNEYTTEKAEALRERCIKESPNPRFHIIYGNRTYECQPENFTKDYAELVKKIGHREMI